MSEERPRRKKSRLSSVALLLFLLAALALGILIGAGMFPRGSAILVLVIYVVGAAPGLIVLELQARNEKGQG